MHSIFAHLLKLWKGQQRWWITMPDPRLTIVNLTWFTAQASLCFTKK
jgi:hypothetical protein